MKKTRLHAFGENGSFDRKSFYLLDAQIRLAYHLVFLELGGVIGQDDLAGLDHVSAVGDGKRHERVLFHQQDGRAFLVDGHDDVEDQFDQKG